MFLVHFIFQLVAYFSKQENSKVVKSKFELLSKKLYLLGIAMLISYNYLQAGIFESVMAWLTLVLGIALHVTTLKAVEKPEIEKILWLAYYFFIFVYFFGIIISFYASWCLRRLTLK